jgi:hypothetical protein
MRHYGMSAKGQKRTRAPQKRSLFKLVSLHYPKPMLMRFVFSAVKKLFDRATRARQA